MVPSPIKRLLIVGSNPTLTAKKSRDGCRQRCVMLAAPQVKRCPANSQVAQWLRAGGAGNVLIPNLSDTTNTSKV